MTSPTGGDIPLGDKPYFWFSSQLQRYRVSGTGVLLEL
jgi:hypothetical protein